jgi:hypothetical protein
VEQDSAAVASLLNALKGDPAALCERLERDIAATSRRLEAIVGSADGLQVSNDRPGTAHHFANVMFNIMRGGVFANQYQIDTADLLEFASIRSRRAIQEYRAFFAALPATITMHELREWADATESADLTRLCYEYLPLTFSRRHGDPSRPWNRFTINVRKADGSQRLDYEGNWRDIFQNWEALAYAYPDFIEGMICTFLSATTADGYNPYRVTRSGIDWEIPEPSNPWANIGYWSDHQIIYLLKLMEVCANVNPGKLETMLVRPMFSHANVPYRLKHYDSLLKNPYDTIEVDWQKEHEIEELVAERGSDGKLVLDADGSVFHTTLGEKLLILLLGKLVNFVPEGGLWMNTQRPEWNDANNALVGKGLSVVTIGYLRRYITFFTDLLEGGNLSSVSITVEVRTLFDAVNHVLTDYRFLLDESISDTHRRAVMDALGQAGSHYRWNYYELGFSGKFAAIETAEMIAFLRLARDYVEHTLRANRRGDNLYHAYNILRLDDSRASVTHLYEMLEGQVAILSSGLLKAEESLVLLQSIRRSALYRADQHSYLLYPDRTLPGFLEKNSIGAAEVADLALVTELVAQGDTSLIVKDMNGIYHFGGHLRNANDVAQVLAALEHEPHFVELVAADRDAILTSITRHLPGVRGHSSHTKGWEASTGIWSRSSCSRRRKWCCAPERKPRPKTSCAHWSMCIMTFGKGLASIKVPMSTGRFLPIPIPIRPLVRGQNSPV